MTNAIDNSSIRAKTVEDAEAEAFGFIKDVLETAYKADGLRGVLAVSSRLAIAADEIKDECEEQGMDESTQRSVVAVQLVLEWAPKVTGQLQKFIDAGGLDALLARGPEIEAAHAKLKRSL